MSTNDKATTTKTTNKTCTQCVEDAGRWVANVAQLLGTALLVLGLVAYAVLLGLAYGAGWPVPRQLLDSNRVLNLGIPISALAAYCIVTTLLLLFPPNAKSGDSVTIKAFSMEFTGPAGPVTLWVVCFLSFVFMLRLLKG